MSSFYHTHNNIPIKTLLRLFPRLDDISKGSQLLIDNDSIHYISLRKHADKISSIIASHLLKFNLDSSQIIVSDCTAGVGGNTLSFAKFFSFVNAIEIDPIRSRFLINNLNIYNFTNVQVFNKDCTALIYSLDNHNVIFIDPPWGGKSYKQFNKLRLSIGSYSLESFCNTLLDNSLIKCSPELIVLKLPINYDIKYFFKYVHSSSIFFHDLTKMFILVIVNKKKLLSSSRIK